MTIKIKITLGRIFDIAKNGKKGHKISKFYKKIHKTKEICNMTLKFCENDSEDICQQWLKYKNSDNSCVLTVIESSILTILLFCAL
jgi:hypothetical protein